MAGHVGQAFARSDDPNRSPGTNPNAFPAINADSFNAGNAALSDTNGFGRTRFHAQNTPVAQIFVNLNVMKRYAGFAHIFQ
jgi:hypothetical protein